MNTHTYTPSTAVSFKHRFACKLFCSNGLWHFSLAQCRQRHTTWVLLLFQLCYSRLFLRVSFSLSKYSFQPKQAQKKNESKLVITAQSVIVRMHDVVLSVVRWYFFFPFPQLMMIFPVSLPFSPPFVQSLFVVLINCWPFSFCLLNWIGNWWRPVRNTNNHQNSTQMIFVFCVYFASSLSRSLCQVYANDRFPFWLQRHWKILSCPSTNEETTKK